MPAVYEVEGFELMRQAIADMQPQAIRYAKEAMRKSCAAVVGTSKEYPDSTEANQPGRYSLKTHKPMGYYERGRGWWYPILQKRTLAQAAGRIAIEQYGGAVGDKYGKSRGVIKAAKMQRALGVAGYKLRAISEQLGRSYAFTVEANESGVFGIVGNNASYARHVVGPLAVQAALMRKRGWRYMEMALDEAGDAIDDAWGEAMDKLVDFWSKGKE